MSEESWDGKKERRNHNRVLPECEATFKNLEKLAESINNKVEDMHKVIIGNGVPGLKTDVAILKEDKKNRDRHIFAIYTAIVTLAVAAIWELVKR